MSFITELPLGAIHPSKSPADHLPIGLPPSLILLVNHLVVQHHSIAVKEVGNDEISLITRIISPGKRVPQ